jgi:hypothetical protein
VARSQPRQLGHFDNNVNIYNLYDHGKYQTPLGHASYDTRSDTNQGDNSFASTKLLEMSVQSFASAGMCVSSHLDKIPCEMMYLD